ncbi:MAG: hypothetical protein JWM78_916 [Verrucomicrobiaceae bacterium]|nr:hypothetical protein [Verrucomicrobiaceae bacterium]
MNGINWLDLLQWPAFVVTVIAAWLVSVDSKKKREVGFLVFIISNFLWVAWGVPSHAYALVALQTCLAVSNVHGIIKNRRN